jgi:hypothetical protein
MYFSYSGRWDDRQGQKKNDAGTGIKKALDAD